MPEDAPATAPAPLTPLQRLGVSEQSAQHEGAQVLLRAWARFEAGDQPGARAVLAPLLRDPVPDDLRAGALVLDRATRVDKTHLLVGLACLALFVTLLALVY